MHARFAALACISLAACGGPQTSQQNNAQANVSNGSRPPAAAAGSTLMPSEMSPVARDQAKPLMHERHEGMETIGKANKSIRDQFDSGSPDLALIRTNAARIADLSQKASGWFHAGTGPDAGMTGAKDEIWQNPQDFMAKLAAFQKAASVFQAAAAGNDLTATKARLSDMTQTCKACHDKYRRDMHPGSMLNP